MRQVKDLIIALFNRWLHCLWWIMPWKLTHPEWKKGGPGHQMVSLDLIEERQHFSNCVVACSCGKIFYSDGKLDSETIDENVS